jgi:hypothetical protein
LRLSQNNIVKNSNTKYKKTKSKDARSGGTFIFYNKIKTNIKAGLQMPSGGDENQGIYFMWPYTYIVGEIRRGMTHNILIFISYYW